ncbi:MAG: c-type cytochrome [Pseudomonadota bacterium]
MRVPAFMIVVLCAMLAACNEGVRPYQVSGGNAEQGRRLIAQFQCGACHAIPGVSEAAGGAGPALRGFGRRSYIAGRIPNLPDPLTRWLVNPPAMKPGTLMPAMGISESDARHMAAYLYTLQ